MSNSGVHLLYHTRALDNLGRSHTVTEDTGKPLPSPCGASRARHPYHSEEG